MLDCLQQLAAQHFLGGIQGQVQLEAARVRHWQAVCMLGRRVALQCEWEVHVRKATERRAREACRPGEDP